MADVGERPSPEAVIQAISEFRTAVSLRPYNSRYHDNLGIALEEAEQTDQALAEYRTAVRLAPVTRSSPDTAPWDNYQFLGNLHIGIGYILLGHKDTKGAILELQQALQYDSNRLDVENDLAGLLNQTGHRKEARALWQDVLTKFPRVYPDGYRTSHFGLDAQTMLTKYPEQP